MFSVGCKRRIALVSREKVAYGGRCAFVSSNRNFQKVKKQKWPGEMWRGWEAVDKLLNEFRCM